MTDTSALEELLTEIGPLAAQDKAAATEEAPQSQALSFFSPGEAISTKILSYLSLTKKTLLL
jgi:hypothetical protein